ncbi:hypothetical protein HMSSN036_62560 [Paenibacillus macerans]|nr:hypothetical protein HMSSN036_62560 [Paenibacillus macerans]
MLALAVTTTLTFSPGAWAAETSAALSYRTVVEVEDFGAQITKLIVDLGQPIPKNAVTEETFTVHVKRSDSRLDDPLIAEGDRKVTKAYVADQNGNPAKETGRYAVLEMEIGPEIKLSPAMNYVDVGVWNDNKYTVTQQKDITTESGVISGLVIDNSAGEIRELVDEFNTGKAAYEGVTLTYADYTPAKDKKKIRW